MPQLKFITQKGKNYDVDAATNQSLMEAAVKANLTEIEGACGGSLACATCHIILEQADFDRLAKLYPVSDEEKDMLELAVNRQKTSRLSCQILLQGDFPPLNVFLP